MDERERPYAAVWDVTPPGSFTSGVEGPACDLHGNVYVVNYDHEGTIGLVRGDGRAEIFVELPRGSTGNGIRLSRDGSTLFVADYTGHSVLRVDLATREIAVHAHEKTLHQPNDLAISADGTLWASDPDWNAGTGRVWRLDAGRLVCERDGMGTTNGIEVAPDEATLYVNESRQRRVWSFPILERGRLGKAELFCSFQDYGLDGMRCDVDGTLYVARHGKGVIAKIAADGTVVDEYQVHGRKCTNISFGGVDGRTLFVTVADRGNVQALRVERPGREHQLLSTYKTH